mgnify:FL=1
MEIVGALSDAFPEKSFCNIIESLMFEEIIDEYERFIIDASSRSRTFAIWSMYVKMTGELAV